MSDEARQPIPGPHPSGARQEPPRLSLEKDPQPTANRPEAAAGPAEDRAAAEAGRAEPVAGAGQWVPVEGREPTLAGQSGPEAESATAATAAAAAEAGRAEPVRDRGSVHDAVPAPGTVHDQQTLTSLPASAPVDAGRAAWAGPAAGYAAPAPGPTAQQPNPFAPPAPAPQPNPFAPPANPFPPYAGAAAEPVPPPPIAPDGPGQVPYGYPGTTPAYGYPGPQAPYAPYPAGPGYAWPGMQAPPSNGMGTASLVLGIISAVGFVMWPIAFVLGVLALIFGGIGRGKAGRGEATNPGVALAGMICGAAGIVLVLGLVALVISVHG
ncbi:DUF4190 domain-containing protein [Streptomyces capoamus]|uniref:DUF4190 domain-containing protein n=1 Tax=Streptomyces capoamus TaxID=68183 RepID=UPI003C2DB062